MKKCLVIIILLFSVFFLLGCDTYIVSPLVPFITSTFNVGIGNGGYLVTSYSIFYVIFSPLLGPLSDKFGRKKMITIGTFIFSLSSFATGAASNYYIIILARCLTGIGAAFAAPNVWAFIGDYFEDKERGRVTAIIASALSLGMILGVPIGSFLAQISNWQTSFYSLSIISLIISISIYVCSPDKRITNRLEQNYINQFKVVFSDKSKLLSFLVTFFIAFANGLYVFLGYWLNKQFNLKVSYIGIFLIMAGLGNLIGMQLGCNFSDKYSKKRIIIISTILMSISLITLPFYSSNIYLTTIDVFLWTGSGGASFSVMQVLVTQLSSSARGTVIAVNNSFMWLGTALGSAAVSFCVSHFSFSAAAALCSLAAFLAAVNIIMFIHERPTTEKLVKQSS